MEVVKLAVLLSIGFCVACVSPSLAAAPVPVGVAGSEPWRVELSGASVVYPYSAQRYATPLEIRVGSTGRPARTILRAQITPGTAVEQLPVLAAGGRQVVAGLADFVRSESSVSIVAASAWAGPPRGPLALLKLRERAPYLAAAAVDGDRAALLVEDRRNRRRGPRLLVRDMRTGRLRSRRLARDVDALRVALAGRYVAIARQPDRDVDRTYLEVRDFRTWKLRTRVTVPEEPLDVEFALRRSGALALIYGFASRRAALARPRRKLVRLAVRPATHEVAFGSRGEIYAQRVRGGVGLIEVTAAGRTRPLTAPIRGFVSFDSDGRRLALRTNRCVYVATLPALDPVPSCVSR